MPAYGRSGYAISDGLNRRDCQYTNSVILGLSMGHRVGHRWGWGWGDPEGDPTQTPTATSQSRAPRPAVAVGQTGRAPCRLACGAGIGAVSGMRLLLSRRFTTEPPAYPCKQPRDCQHSRGRDHRKAHRGKHVKHGISAIRCLLFAGYSSPCRTPDSCSFRTEKNSP